MSNEPSVQSLDESLKDLVRWERVALHLPQITQSTIDKITIDNPGNVDGQKQALYGTWLRVCPHAMWDNVVQALEIADENRLAAMIRHRLNIKRRELQEWNTKKLTEKIEERVVNDLRRLHRSFESLVQDVERRCGHLIISLQISLDDISRPLFRSKSVYKISDIHTAETASELFELLSNHMTFLDCDLLETVVEKLPQSDELIARVRNHIQSVRSFKCETPIRSLQNKLKPFIRQAHFNEISLLVIFELEEAWGKIDMSLFEELLNTMFPILSKEMKWYKVVPGSVCITLFTCKSCEENLFSMTEGKQIFLKLVGVISLKINGKVVFCGSETKAYSFNSALLEASSIGNREALFFFLTVVSVDYQNENSETALMKAIANSQTKTAELLLNAKANPNHQRHDGSTPLHIACYKGSTQLAVMLIEFGADPTITDAKGDTPFLSSVRGKMMEVVMMIAPKLAKPEIPPAILLACRLGYSNIISFLLQYLDPPSSKIHVYCANGDLALTAQYVVEFCDDINCTLVLGITPLMIASSCGHHEVVECLVEASANVNSVDQDGYSPLAFAITGSQSIPVIECLLEAGADAFVTVDGITLLQMVKTDNTNCSDVLVQYMGLQLYNMFSSLIKKIQNDLASEVDAHKVTLSAIQSKLVSDPEFSHVDGIATNASSLSNLFTCLQPHYDFLSWKAISLLSDCLKQDGYFKLVEMFEKSVEIEMFPKAISLQQSSSVSSSLACSELTLSLHTQWGTQSMFNLRRLCSLLFSSVARLMSQVTVTFSQQEILISYKIPQSMKMEQLDSSSYTLSSFLGVHTIAFNGEILYETDNPFIAESAMFLASLIPSFVSSTKFLGVMKILIKFKEVNPNYRGHEGRTALHISCFFGYSDIVEFLLSHGMQIDCRDDDGQTPLYMAALQGHLKIVKMLVERFPSVVDIAGASGLTPLMLASEKGHTDVVKWLLESDSNPNLIAADGFTALMGASHNGYTIIVKLLLQAGANPNAMNQSGESALMMACSKGHTEVVKALLHYNSDYMPYTLHQSIPFDSFGFSCFYGNIKTVCFLQDSVNLNTRSLSLGWYISCLYKRCHLIEYLVHSLSQLSSDKRELVVACVNGDLAFIKNKLCHSVDGEFVHGVTLLMVAGSCGKASIVQYLLDTGASILKEDEFGFKAIDYIDKNSYSLQQLVGQKGSDTAVRTFNRTENIFSLPFSKGVSSFQTGLEQLANASLLF